MNKYIKYFNYIIKHKWYVAKECFKYGLYWRAIKHDWTKFLPSEFMPYVNNFYGKPDKDAFNRAWLHHQHNNSHHWQHWVLKNDDGTVIALEMPLNDALEMICDWRGAGMAIHGYDEVEAWYLKNYNIINLHINTREFVDKIILKSEL